MVRSEETADDSLAARRERNRLGTAMAAMTSMTATTISNSIRLKPRLLRIVRSSKLRGNKSWGARTRGRIAEARGSKNLLQGGRTISATCHVEGHFAHLIGAEPAIARLSRNQRYAREAARDYP